MALESILMLHFAILLLCFCTGIFHVAESTALSIVSDKEALMSLKSQINMEMSNPLSTWDQDSSSPCNWTGVVCNRNGQRVIGLDLSGLRLSGSISPYLGNLSFLRSLQMQNNQLTGNLPEQLGNLFRLRSLNVSFNSLTGAIPSNISQCKELRVLDLMQNRMTGGIPEEIGQLKELQVLNLARNQLFGPFSSSLVNISTLTNLNLGTNSLDGPIPSDLSHLRNLKYLDLTINNFTGTVPASIYNMSSLVYLALASNDLWGDLPSNVGVTLPNLLGFNFCINKFTGTIPGSLHNLTRIRIIRMAHNLLHGSVPPGLGNLPDLEMYNIGYNRIVSSGTNGFSFLESLKNSTRLNFLAVDSNLLEGVIPETIGNLSKVLKKFYMGGNRVYGSIPPSVGQLRGLELLDMSNEAIYGEIPPEIGQLEELQVLGLAGNLLSGKIPNSLGNLQKLNKIDLSKNELLGSIPATFKNFQSLLSMDLSNNKLNGSIPPEILHLPSLSAFLNLSRNCLTGPLPEEVGFLEGVVTIDISDNRLSGEIPKAIGNCKSLEHLLLARNMLSGHIPDTLGDIRGLGTLDLSLNQLNGTIPFDLKNLQALQVLNLSFNNLEGDVPSGGVFVDPSKVHLEGNKNLCLETTCNNRHAHRRRLILVSSLIGALIAVCFTVAFLFYLRKGKAKVETTSESLKHRHRMIAYNELCLATNNFSKENLVGIGSFGSVYKGQLTEGTAVAVKVINTEATGSWKSFTAECAALRHVRHRNLVKLITTCSSIDFKNSGFLALVYEFMSNGNLEDWITGKRRTSDGEGLNVVDRLNVAIDIACAINYLHHECEAPIVHCDLKPSNILLDSDMTAKVGDFGLARLLINNGGDQPSISCTHTLKGSIGYIPPEYGFGEKPSTAGDVYSFGILLLELFTGRSPRHASFTEGLSLKKWVDINSHTNIEEVLYPELHEEGDSIDQEIQGDCLIKVMGIGLSCAADSPDNRITMRVALHRLKAIRDALLKPDRHKNSKSLMHH
ncbi:uncharacterized protein [Coffea arabica]|uniref:non-specific serine/threonine protein kinase n=1 Tax=Coffea arabica TaxID=13443 RepID=A0A6P6UW15_COFAR|nr:putative receptor-like protein kinase At3g47110 [Coffea arabica]